MKKDFIKEMEKANEVYSNLITQRDLSRSKTLCESLGREIDAFFKLLNAYNECSELLVAKIEKNGDRIDAMLEKNYKFLEDTSDLSIKVMHLKFMKKTHDKMAALGKIDESIYEHAIEIFLSAVSRDFRDWDCFVDSVLKFVGETIKDVVTAVDPVASASDFAVEKIKGIIELIKQYRGDDIDYLKIDRELLVIEVHTEIMEFTANAFLEWIKILRKQ